VSWDVLADANFLRDKDDKDGIFRGMIIPDGMRHVHSTTAEVEKQ